MLRINNLLDVVRTLSVLLLLLLVTKSHANNWNRVDTAYNGIVVYNVTYEALPGSLVDEALIDKQAKEAELLFSNNNSRFTMAGQELKQVRYANGYIKDYTDVLYVYEKKSGNFGEPYGAIRKEFRDIQVELAKTPPPKVNFTNETKVIQGLTCKKAEIKTWDEFGFEHNAEVYYYEHPSLSNLYFHTEFRSIKGLLMEYEFVSQGFIVKYTATEFKEKKKIKPKEFEIPENVVYYTFEEINKINERGYD